ncbi:MAG: CoA ester lyase [Propionibacteriales bacterium]|nr:CoA ester lyase [Propionibacteriales bacterium]
MSRLSVTLLYVPADRPDRVAKALATDADVVIVDLEDAVAPSAKAAARDAVPGLVSAADPDRVQVRVNGSSSPWGRDDLAMVASLPAGVSVRLPKVESLGAVDVALDVLDGRSVHALLESALGVEHAFSIAAGGVASVGLGEQDLRSELGVDDRGLAWARGRVVVAARAAGLPPPVQSVFTHLHDPDGLVSSCRAGRALGFVGRCAIHPGQLAVIRAAYRPDGAEVDRARDLLAQVDSARRAGSGVAVLTDGSFVDAAMVEGARRVLELARLTADG